MIIALFVAKLKAFASGDNAPIRWPFAMLTVSLHRSLDRLDQDVGYEN
jgi:hypothetical protein